MVLTLKQVFINNPEELPFSWTPSPKYLPEASLRAVKQQIHPALQNVLPLGRGVGETGRVCAKSAAPAACTECQRGRTHASTVLPTVGIVDRKRD